jgi:hypothetical protein
MLVELHGRIYASGNSLSRKRNACSCLIFGTNNHVNLFAVVLQNKMEVAVHQ